MKNEHAELLKSIVNDYNDLIKENTKKILELKKEIERLQSENGELSEEKRKHEMMISEVFKGNK